LTQQEWCVSSSESTEKRIRKLPIGAGIDPLKHGKNIRFAGDVPEILELLNSKSLVGIADHLCNSKVTRSIEIQEYSLGGINKLNSNKKVKMCGHNFPNVDQLTSISIQSGPERDFLHFL